MCGITDDEGAAFGPLVEWFLVTELPETDFFRLPAVGVKVSA